MGIDYRFGRGYIGATGGGSGSGQHCRPALHPQTKHPGGAGPQRTADQQPRSHHCEPLVYFKFTSDDKAPISYQENKHLNGAIVCFRGCSAWMRGRVLLRPDRSWVVTRRRRLVSRWRRGTSERWIRLPYNRLPQVWDKHFAKQQPILLPSCC